MYGALLAQAGSATMRVRHCVNESVVSGAFLAQRLAIVRMRHCVNELVVFGALLARDGPPSCRATICFAKIGPLRARFSLLRGLSPSFDVGGRATNAIFGRVAGRKLPKKLPRGRTPSRSAPWTVPCATKLGHNDAPSGRRASLRQEGAVHHGLLNSTTQPPRVWTRPRVLTRAAALRWDRDGTR